MQHLFGLVGRMAWAVRWEKLPFLEDLNGLQNVSAVPHVSLSVGDFHKVAHLIGPVHGKISI